MPMNEILAEISRTNQLIGWALMAIALMDFLGLIAVSWAIYLTRNTNRMVEQSLEEGRKISFYLYGKLGPLDLK